jgi:hypothetical protein
MVKYLCFILLTESDALAGIGNLTYFASQEDDPYITLKGEVIVAYSGSHLDRFYSPCIEIYIYRIGGGYEGRNGQYH